jgi:hypothetical protein
MSTLPDTRKRVEPSFSQIRDWLDCPVPADERDGLHSMARHIVLQACASHAMYAPNDLHGDVVRIGSAALLAEVLPLSLHMIEWALGQLEFEGLISVSPRGDIRFTGIDRWRSEYRTGGRA